MLAVKLAIRGLWRHRMRTIFTLLAIAIGQMFLLVMLCMSDGAYAEMIEIAIRQGSAGHVVVQAKGYQRSRAVELLVPDGEAVREKIEKRVPDARVVLRAFGGGLARSSADSVGVLFAGVEPGREHRVSELAKKVRKGVYLGASAKQVQQAEARDKLKPGTLWCALPPKQGEPRWRPVVIGVKLAKTLKLKLCDKLVVNAQGLSDQESQQFRVVGLFQTFNEDLDGFFLQAPLGDIQQLLGLGGGVHQVAVILDSAERAPAVTSVVQQALRGEDDLEILPWSKALPEMAEFIAMKKASGWVFIGIVLLIVAIGVLNTVFMSVMERTREFGVMRALGTGPGRVLGLVLAEGALLGLIGVMLGLAFSLPITNYLETTGIVYPEPVEAVGISIKAIKGKLYLTSAIYGSLAVFLMALSAAVLPAIRAARVRMLEAIHNV